MKVRARWCYRNGLTKQMSIASNSTYTVNLLHPLPSAQTHIKKAEWRVVSNENNLWFHFCCPISCIMCCFQSQRHWQCVWVMSMTQLKRCVANLALHWERQSHFNQGYWGGVCLGRQARAFKDLTNKTCQRELGNSQNWYADLLPICFPSGLTPHCLNSIRTQMAF